MSSTTRRQFLRWGLAAAMGCAVGSGCAHPERVTVGVQTWAGFQFMALGERFGWYADQPLDLVTFKRADAVAAALIAGQIDAATVTLDEAVRLRAQDHDLQVALICDISAGNDAVLAAPGIESLADLRGRRLGVETTALGAVLLAETLHLAGLTAGDLKIVSIEEDHSEAWHRGGLDAVLSYGHSGAQLRREGLRVLADSRSFRQVILDVLLVRRSRHVSHRDAIRALVEGHFRALDLWRRNPIDATQELSTMLGTLPERVRSFYEGLDLPDAASNREWLRPPATALTATANLVAEVLVDAGWLDRVPDLGGLFTAAYLPPHRA